MTGRKTASVKVTILGEEYTLRSAASPEETQTVAKYVDQSIRQIMQSGLVVETQKASILAMLRMAGELFQARSEAERLTAEMRALSEQVRPWLPPAKRYD